MDVVVSGQLFSYLNAKIHKMHFNTALYSLPRSAEVNVAYFVMSER